MSRKKFFLPQKIRDEAEFEAGSIIKTGNQLYNHMIKSLRMSKGDRVQLLDGEGRSAKARIKDIFREDEQLILKLLTVKEATGEPKTKIYIAQALGKKDKVEYVWQKGTEIGAAGFIPFSSQHTVVKLNSKKEQKRLKRWRRIIREAARQSERGKLPELFPVRPLKDLKDKFSRFDFIMLACAREGSNTIGDLARQDFLSSGDEILVIIGPEGGFSQEEISLLLQEENCSDISLGPRILRTETAGPLITGLILHELGEME